MAYEILVAADNLQANGALNFFGCLLRGDQVAGSGQVDPSYGGGLGFHAEGRRKE